MASDLWICVVVFFSFSSQVVPKATPGQYAQKSNHTVGLTCGNAYCNSHCCIDSSTEELICCDEENEDYLWWFWIALIIAVLVLSMCFGACCCKFHHRQVHRHYLIAGQENPAVVTTYGTETVAPVLRRVPQEYYQTPSPAYTQAKLPSYTTAAEDIGNPPPYQENR